MVNYTHLLKKSSLFSDISDDNIQKLCTCLNSREKTIEKDAYVFQSGDTPRSIYLVLSGSLYIIDDDLWGNRSIIETIGPYTLFGEAYMFAARDEYLVSVIGAEDSMLLELDPMRLFEACSNNCACHAELIKNTTYILSEKIVRLTEKSGHIIRRTTREKILSYLSACARQAHSNSFDIPYSRQQLADYLCVDRSALSHELSRMNRLGILRHNKNHFELLNQY